MCVSKIEQLPDEILLEILIYLKPFDIINAFGQLNHRFDRTIGQYRRDGDLHHVTLQQFQHWWNHLLIYTANSIKNLVISNWNSPGQIYLFNQLTKDYVALCHLFPNLKQLRLIDLTDNDIEILPKLQSIEKILIDVDALIPISHSTHALLDKYLFGSFYNFKEIRLWGIDGGIQLQHHVNIVQNFYLEKLTISVALLDDLLLTYKRCPNLTNLNIEIAQHSMNLLRQVASVDILPKKIVFFHFQTTDQHVLTFTDFDKLVSNMPTIELLSVDVDTKDINYVDGTNWYILLSYLPNLKHIFFKIRFWLTSDAAMMNIDSTIESFKSTNLPICCYMDTKVLHVDTVPYNMTKFDSNMSVTTSPSARLAKTTNIEAFLEQPKRVQTLIIDGQHESISIKNWLTVIERFSRIEILQMNAINIKESEDTMITNFNKTFKLPKLNYLHYIRSTNCKVHIPFFLFLTKNRLICPQLKALSIMYGDLIYLCRRLSDCCFERIKELWLYGGEADGRVILKDILLLLKTFPCLVHFFFNSQSSRLINRDLISIIQVILSSSTNLVSFRISCNKGSLKLMNEETFKIWITNLCSNQPIHISTNKKFVSVWK